MSRLKDHPSQARFPVVYYCNPERNGTCKKSSCYVFGGPCHLTFYPEQAIILDGKPMRGPKIYGPLADGMDVECEFAKSQTNAARIRAMTDEELAEYLFVKTYEDGYPQFGTIREWLDWLRQEGET